MREALDRELRRRPPLRRLLRDLARAIAAAGGTTYLVGGFLRNIVEGREPGDVDLLVTGLSYRRTGEVLRSLPVKVPGIRKVVAAGRHFPVHRIAVDWGKEYIDVSNARAGGRPRPQRSGDRPANDDREAIDDASRRDFTINALLFRLAPDRGAENGRLIDPFGGIEDVRRKRIRCVGEASDRFREDPLRIVRAIRLKNERRGFVLDPATASAIRRLGPRLLPAASPDRLSVELVRALSADPAGTIDDLRRHGLLKPLLPESGKSTNRSAERIAGRYRFLRRSLGAPLPLPLLLGNLLADLPFEAAVGAARRLRLPDLRSVASTLRCLHTLTHPEALRFPRAETEAALLATDDMRGAIALYRAVQRTGKRSVIDMNRFMRKCRAKPLIISGIWLEKNEFPEGAGRGRILLATREATLSGKIRTREEALRMAEELL
ncbi:MAG: CCA tRNA nucleotidyltransferase [Deltaproteobacteria bacterium]|nr:CCA tRNA nucleotidyltransferase [Deltaproteobacteria bacterium]